MVGMLRAEVAELADAQASEACGGNPVGVQLPPSAPFDSPTYGGLAHGLRPLSFHARHASRMVS